MPKTKITKKNSTFFSSLFLRFSKVVASCSSLRFAQLNMCFKSSPVYPSTFETALTVFDSFLSDYRLELIFLLSC